MGDGLNRVPTMPIATVAIVGICVVVDIGYALAGKAMSELAMTARAVRLKNRVAGSALVLAGLSLLRERPV